MFSLIYVSAKCCLPANEPDIPAKESNIPAGELDIPAIESNISVTVHCVSTKEQYISIMHV